MSSLRTARSCCCWHWWRSCCGCCCWCCSQRADLASGSSANCSAPPCSFSLVCSCACSAKRRCLHTLSRTLALSSVWRLVSRVGLGLDLDLPRGARWNSEMRAAHWCGAHRARDRNTLASTAIQTETLSRAHTACTVSERANSAARTRTPAHFRGALQSITIRRDERPHRATRAIAPFSKKWRAWESPDRNAAVLSSREPTRLARSFLVARTGSQNLSASAEKPRCRAITCVPHDKIDKAAVWCGCATSPLTNTIPCFFTPLRLLPSFAWLCVCRYVSTHLRTCSLTQSDDAVGHRSPRFVLP